jgi:uncharacterized membrane protein YqgA involved in biofilm formation
MNAVIRNILAVVVGLVVGSIVNMTVLTTGHSIILPPTGANLNTMEGLKASMHLMEPRHYISPFLAHALGSVVGAFLASLISKTLKQRCAMIVGAFFLLAGITNIFMLPSPMWFNIVDILFAYIPMAMVGYWIYIRFVSR